MIKRTITITATAASALLIATGTAAAHVSATTTNSAADGWGLAEFSVGHGCDGAGTTKLEIKMPEGYDFPHVTPYESAGWSPTTTKRKLDKPAEGMHGDSEEGVDTVVFTRTGDALPDGTGSIVAMRIHWPKSAAGKDLYFPVAQSCEGGKSTDWNQVPGEGEDADALVTPAPMVAITKAAGGGHHGSADKDSHSDMKSDDSTMHSGGDDVDHAEHMDAAEAAERRANISLGVGILGVLVGMVAIGRGRRKGSE